MTPFDWKALMHTIVTPIQYQVWLQQYNAAADTQATDNLGCNIPRGAVELWGEGAFLDIWQQVQCHPQFILK